jgi:hypothetical protein
MSLSKAMLVFAAIYKPVQNPSRSLTKNPGEVERRRSETSEHRSDISAEFELQSHRGFVRRLRPTLVATQAYDGIREAVPGIKQPGNGHASG